MLKAGAVLSYELTNKEYQHVSTTKTLNNGKQSAFI